MRRGVDALGVVVVNVLPEQASQVVLAEDDHVIEQLSSNASDEAFGRPVLPRDLESRPLWMNPETRDRPSHFGGKD